MIVTVSAILAAISVVLLIDLVIASIAYAAGASFRRFFITGLWAVLMPVILFMYGMTVERNIYRVNDVAVQSPTVPLSFDGYKIVHISDLHLRSFRLRPRSLEKAVRKINSLGADMIVFTGDLVTAHPSEIDGLDRILSGLQAADGVYSVLGNHDYCIYYPWKHDSLRVRAVEEVIQRQGSMGWTMLMNGNVNITRHRNGASEKDTISLIGVENISNTTYFPSYGDLGKAMEGADGSFKILLSHDPTHWRKAVAQYPEIDLTLSGHTHAMQLSFFGWSPSSLLFDEYKGLYNTRTGNRENSLYVNIGLGETAIPARIGASPEITLIELKCTSRVTAEAEGEAF